MTATNALSFLLLILLPLGSLGSDLEGHTCLANHTLYPCQSYAFFRAISPGFLDLASVGDLFGTSRLSIARASNISSLLAPLYVGQPLIIPLTCSCYSNNSHSYSLIPYQIKGGDTFYIVSTTLFQNLTTYQAVEVVNPQLVPTNLDIGVITIFPVFCQCPIKVQSSNGSFVVTYVVQQEDTLGSIASSFGADLAEMGALNGGLGGGKLEAFSTILVPVSTIPVSLKLFEKRKQLPTPSASPPLPSTPASGNSSGKGKDVVIIVLGVLVGVLGAMVVLLFVVVQRESWVGYGNFGSRRRVSGGRTDAQLVASDGGLVADISDCLDKYKVFQIDELRRATSNFDTRCLIHGSVYEGWLNGHPYAIKRMKWNADQELRILQKVNHTNLVKLEGFCINSEDGTCYLVYEYVENGSLHSWLRDSIKRSKLDWHTRLKIALDVANGLQYIHDHAWPTVVHKDVSSANILLDGKLRAKIANFGLARSGCNAMTTHIVGTQGYAAPEYLLEGIMTTKMDVFAYGVVLLELVSGMEAIKEDGEVLFADVDRVFEGGEEDAYERLKSWMDGALSRLGYPLEGVVSVMSVARACLQRDPSKRPRMADIVYTLSKADGSSEDHSGDKFADYSNEVVGR